MYLTESIGFQSDNVNLSIISGAKSRFDCENVDNCLLYSNINAKSSKPMLRKFQFYKHDKKFHV